MSETPEKREPDEEFEPPTAEEPILDEETVEEPPPTEAVEDPAIPDRLTPDPDTFTEGLVGGPIDAPPRIRAEFPVVFRGYDREVVDAHLAALEEDVAELHATRTPQSAVRRELDRVGQETSAILQRAHESADEITRRSRTRAAARIEEAERQADEIRREAEARLKRIDKDTDDVWADRRRLLEDARSTGEALIRLADEALERFPPAEDGGPPVEPPPRPPRPPVARAAQPEPAPIPEVEPAPAPEPELEPEPDTQLEEAPPPLSDEAPVVDEGDPSIESVRRIPRPGAPTHPRRPRR